VGRPQQRYKDQERLQKTAPFLSSGTARLLKMVWGEWATCKWHLLVTYHTSDWIQSQVFLTRVSRCQLSPESHDPVGCGVNQSQRGYCHELVVCITYVGWNLYDPWLSSWKHFVRGTVSSAVAKMIRHGWRPSWETESTELSYPQSPKISGLNKIILNSLLIKLAMKNMYVSIYLANWTVILKMKAAYKTLTVDIMNLRVYNEPTSIIM